MKLMKASKILYTSMALIAIMACTSASCNKGKTGTDNVPTTATAQPVGPNFNADSAFLFCQAQCDFGPRTMNSEAHEQCATWIANTFRRFGCEVTLQKATLRGFDATPLQSTNIIASIHSERPYHVMLCAHWDSRPWADNDPDSTNWRKPVMAANDGASGVGVMLELARLLQNDTTLKVGVDFICFDAEDWGVPQWMRISSEDSWALGAQYWANNYQKPTQYTTLYGILLDMVGGQQAQFYQERMSMDFAPSVVDKVWKAARDAGYSDYFPFKLGGQITDDHVPVNQKAGIPTIDIIPYYPNCLESTFGPTWHTVYDDMAHLDKNTLKAVGQTIIQVLFTEE